MATKLGVTPKRGASDGPATIAAPAAGQAHPSIPSTPEALIALGEELGRLFALRELARRDGRRGYSLVELLIGAASMALAWSLVARMLGLLR